MDYLSDRNDSVDDYFFIGFKSEYTEKEMQTEGRKKL